MDGEENIREGDEIKNSDITYIYIEIDTKSLSNRNLIHKRFKNKKWNLGAKS